MLFAGCSYSSYTHILKILFSIRDDQAMLDLIQSVQTHGVLVPAIAHPRPEGEFEIVAGHRRKHASELAGLDFMLVITAPILKQQFESANPVSS